MNKFGGYFETVDALFPELSLDMATYKQCTFITSSLFFAFVFIARMVVVTNNIVADMWDEEDKRRQFFETYALMNEFDALVADNWYAQPKDKIMSYKVRPVPNDVTSRQCKMIRRES